MLTAVNLIRFSFNYGNWKNIKDYMDFYGFNFTMQQIEDHYKTVYLSNNNSAYK